jgi:hypothetical protein
MRLTLAIAAICVVAYGFSQRPTVQPTKADQLRLEHLQHVYASTKIAYKKKPSDTKARKAFVLAATSYGHESMVSPVLPAKIKYRQALRIYREVLKLDPKNPVAKPESDLIISIYKSMGREVPKD